MYISSTSPIARFMYYCTETPMRRYGIYMKVLLNYASILELLGINGLGRSLRLKPIEGNNILLIPVVSCSTSLLFFNKYMQTQLSKHIAGKFYSAFFNNLINMFIFHFDIHIIFFSYN